MSNSKLESIGAGIIAAPLVLVVVVAAMAYGAFANGYVLAHMWSWYAVPLGAPAVGWSTFAVFMMARYMVAPSKWGDDSDSKGAQAVWHLIALLACPWLALLLAWWFKS